MKKRAHGRAVRLAIAAVAAAAALLTAAACGGGDSASKEPVTNGPGGDAPGTIVYVDKDGCIARVDASGAGPAYKTFCTPSRSGVSAVTWFDDHTASFTTPETRGLGWRMLDFRTMKDDVLPVAEAPRVLFIGAPQMYSIRAEQIEVDSDGMMYRVENGTKVATIFTPEVAQGTTRLLTWSPDGDWILFQQTTSKDLSIIKRDGTGLRTLVSETRGLASWFIPEVGAMPHADLTCSLPTLATWNCQVELRAPVEAETIDPAKVAGRLDLAWTACPGVTGYEVEVLPLTSETPVIQSVVAGQAYHEAFANLPGGLQGTWRWRVRSVIGTEHGPWSDVRTFTVNR